MAPLSKILFHGSDHEFNEGDVVTPQRKSKYAWATTDREYVKNFGANVYEVDAPEDMAEAPGNKPGAGVYVSEKGFTIKGKAK